MIDHKKKIIFMLPLLCSGGAERALITLMNNLDRDKYAPEMIALNAEGSLRAWIKEDIPFHDLNGRSVRNSFFALRRKLKELNPDIVMTTMAPANFLLMSLKLFFPRAKFIIREAVIPSSILRTHPNKSWLIKFLYTLLYPMADHIISPSADVIEEFKTILKMDTSKHTVLYNQVDTQAIFKTLEGKLDIADTSSALHFVCAGRLHHQKGYDRLIPALKNFSPNHPWKLDILGEGSERDALKSLIDDNNLSDNINLLGNIAEPWRIIAAADCLLLPSRWEGMPNIVLESLACGTPVIASQEANGVREIKDAGSDCSVLIAKDMTEFVSLMSNIIPQNKDEAAPSLLPCPFESAAIMADFEKILSH